MTSPTDYIKLVIWRPEGQTCRWVSALRATADYYGWTQEFEIWTPKRVATSGSYQLGHWPDRSGRGHARGGKRRRISRSTSRQGNPARLTNQFTISNSMRTLDMAELAHFTKSDWHWMEDLSGVRVSRDHWEEIYEVGNRQLNRGLVSV